jgi:multidrug resistance protein, MATE family
MPSGVVRVTDRFIALWRGPGGVREVLSIGLPLILSQMSYTLQAFVDRVFLTWYSPEAVAGAVTAGFMVWSIVGIFIGTGEYLTAFIGQYYGARRYTRVGIALWQGFYFALLAGAVLVALVPLMTLIFHWAGHAPAVQRYELEYAGIFLGGSGAAVMMATLSTFFAGRGKTRVILLVNVVLTCIHMALDWWWIFDGPGHMGWGVRGAAAAAVASQVIGACAYAILILRPSARATYGTLAGWRFDPALFRRLLRFGLPTGLQFSLEIFAFALFMLIVGRIGTVPLAATSLAFSLNMIVFMPTLGLGVGVSSLVARYLGAEQPELAERSTWSAFGISLSYMTVCSLAYVLLPRVLLAPYAAASVHGSFGPVTEVAVVLLRFVAFYSIFDMSSAIFAAGLRGAGDTAYPMKVTLVFSWVALLIPTYVACVMFGLGLYAAWTAATLYVFCLGVMMQRRFRKGGWKSLRIVEPATVEIA